MTLASMQTRLLLVRHGETEWNANGKAQGHQDIPLNETGKAQAKATAKFLIERYPAITAIYSSDLIRAYTTALETASLLNLPIIQKFGLREAFLGEGEGMDPHKKQELYGPLWDEILTSYHDKRQRWQYSPIPGEETTYELIVRIKTEILQIAYKHCGTTVAIFSHGRAIRSFLADMQDRDVTDIAMPNCGIVEVLFNADHSQPSFFFQQFLLA